MGYFTFPKDGRLPIYHNHPHRSKKPLPPLEIVSRKEWGAKYNTDEDDYIKHPAHYVRDLISDTDGCYTRDECCKFMKDLQEKQMASGMSDIQYNFYIGGDGNVYEGRGWELESDRQDEEMQFEYLCRTCIEVCYIGKYDRIGSDVPKLMTDAGQLFIKHAVNMNYLKCCHREIPFGDVE